MRVRWLVGGALAFAVAAATGTVGTAATASGRQPAADAARPLAHAAIVGGTTAMAGQFPWLAYIIYLSSNKEENCTGTVVAPGVVLTAAHCLVDRHGHRKPLREFHVVTGGVNVAASHGLQVSRVSREFIYPGYSKAAAYEGDAAALVLATPTTQPAIRLADRADTAYLRAGDNVTIAGWGDTEPNQARLTYKLRWGILVTQRPAYCAAHSLPFDAARQFCAVDPNFAVTGCSGDSGGPAIVSPTTATYLQIGIASGGDPECRKTEPVVYTRADLVYSWIYHVIAEAAKRDAPVARHR